MYLYRQTIAFIERFVMWFYPPFSRLMPEQTFKYAATGGMNTVLDIFLYFVSYNYILEKQDLDLGLVVLSPHIAAFFLAFLVTFPTGFIMAKNISFPGSYLRRRVQLFRYGVAVSISIGLNYVFIKLFVEVFHIYPTPSKMITTLIVIAFSYTAQKYFTFRQ